MTACTQHLICPVCGEGLSESGRAFRCPHGHTYDRAREGYVHLLPAGHGRSRLTGDVRDMVRARQRFLAGGYFEPLARALVGQALRLAERREGRAGALPGLLEPGVTELGRTGPDLTVLDVGCGDGYYGGRIREAFAGASHCFYGLDLSKEALRLAARAHPDITFFVNDLRHRICLADASVDLLLDVFAPRNVAEFARVLRRDGVALVVVPNPEHLRELRAHVALLQVDADKEERTVDRLSSHFEQVGRERIIHEMTLEPGDVVDLIRMTPNYWHASDEDLASVAELGGLTVTSSVSLLRFRRFMRSADSYGAAGPSGSAGPSVSAGASHAPTHPEEVSMTAPVIPIEEFDQEMAATRRLLERVPEDKGAWKPHEKSFALGHLAQLVAWMPGWIGTSLRDTSIDLMSGGEYSFEPTETLLEQFDDAVAEARAALQEVTGGELDVPWSLKRGDDVIFTLPRGVVVRQHLNHLIHHRGQLTVYLRLVDVPLPSIYGPTADERW